MRVKVTFHFFSRMPDKVASIFLTHSYQKSRPVTSGLFFCKFLREFFSAKSGIG